MTSQFDCETGNCPPDDGSLKKQDIGAVEAKAAANGGRNGAPEDVLDWTTFHAPFDASAFHGPLSPSIVIEYCNRCRWQHRATWIQTELFLTFEDKPDRGSGEDGASGKYATSTGLKGITLIPCNATETGGRFRVWLYRNRRADEPKETHTQQSDPAQAGQTSPLSSTTAHGSHTTGDSVTALLWDRKIRGGFPELKELKQMVRDQIAPATSLGHSDKKGTA